jgi:hypothetical protein
MAKPAIVATMVLPPIILPAVISQLMPILTLCAISTDASIFVH